MTTDDEPATRPTAEEVEAERFPTPDEVQEEAARTTVAELAEDSGATSLVVMPIADATAVSAALAHGEVAILVSEEIIEASLREIAETSGVPLDRVRKVHDALLNGDIVVGGW